MCMHCITVPYPKPGPDEITGTHCGKAEEAAWKNCPEGQFFQAALRLFHSWSDFENPIGQSGTFKTCQSLKQKPKEMIRTNLMYHRHTLIQREDIYAEYPQMLAF